jgi:hypothetical protein
MALADGDLSVGIRYNRAVNSYYTARWRRSYAWVCKTQKTGALPVRASNFTTPSDSLY